jgi:hypothetical protein
MRCSKCGSDNREGRKFCTNCGTPLVATCPKCSAPIQAGEKFCGECGAAIGASVADRYRHFADLAMLAMSDGGMERSESEFRKLLADGAFRLSRVIPTKAPQWIIEAFPQ